MRVNIYAEESTDRIEIIEKQTADGGTFTGLRFYLELPASFYRGARPATVTDVEPAAQYKAPFIHHPGDDDSAAVTFWGKRDLRKNLRKALELLDAHYASRGHPVE